MIWQDVVIMVSLFGFSLALVPTVLGKSKPAKLTCIMTILFQLAIAISFVTLHLWLSFTGGLLVTSMWTILLFQRRTQ